jgi:isoleucyl-tRNA synthetase
LDEWFLTPELEAEGAARDAIRHIQQARKDAGLDVSDRISLTIRCDEGSVAALEAHREFIANETLAVEFAIATASVSGELSIGDSGLIEIELAKN